MLILGVDPGTATTGYGIVRVNPEERPISIGFDLIETSKERSPEKRLHRIHSQLLHIIEIYKPDEMAMEKVFFATNRKTAIRVGQAQGVMLLAAASSGIPVMEYAPGTIKKLVAGNGRADKKEVQVAIRKILGKHVKERKGEKTHFDNAADALAVAMCHIYTCKYASPS